MQCPRYPHQHPAETNFCGASITAPHLEDYIIGRFG